jgi:hypothetical protein
VAAAPFALPGVLAALRAKLVIDTTLASMLATYASGFGTGPAIYSENGVPPKAAFPYLTIGAPTEVPFDTMGPGNARGSNCTIQVKAFSAKMRDDEALAIMAEVKDLLDEASMSVSGYGSVVCEFDSVPDLFIEVVGGVSIRQLPMIFRVYVHQSA